MLVALHTATRIHHYTSLASTIFFRMTQIDVPAVVATTCSGQWRRDARLLGSLPFVHWGRWVPPFCVLMPSTLFLEYLFLWQF